MCVGLRFSCLGLICGVRWAMVWVLTCVSYIVGSVFLVLKGRRLASSLRSTMLSDYML